MSSLEQAIIIATQAHTGQTDKAGQPYILHPLRVMLAVKTPEEQLTAMLHDIVEDTHLRLNDLAAEGFPPEVLEAVDQLTKKNGESRIDAAKRALTNPIARNVKIADVLDNMNLNRIPNPSAEDYARMKEYEKVLDVLMN